MKKFFRQLMKRRKLMTGASLAVAVTLIFWAVNSPTIVGASAAKRLLPIYSVRRDNKAVSLTFDAAWGNAILRRNYKAARRTMEKSEYWSYIIKKVGCAVSAPDFILLNLLLGLF